MRTTFLWVTWRASSSSSFTFGASSAVQFVLDTDEHAATGHQGSDSLCTADNGVIGVEHIVDFGTGSIASVVYGGNGTQASVLPFAGPSCNQFGGVTLTASGSVSYVTDGVDVTFPLALVGNDDGRLRFKVLSYGNLGGNAFTGVLDRMSEAGQPPGQVQ